MLNLLHPQPVVFFLLQPTRSTKSTFRNRNGHGNCLISKLIQETLKKKFIFSGNRRRFNKLRSLRGLFEDSFTRPNKSVSGNTPCYLFLGKSLPEYAWRKLSDRTLEGQERNTHRVHWFKKITSLYCMRNTIRKRSLRDVTWRGLVGTWRLIYDWSHLLIFSVSLEKLAGPGYSKW